MTWAFRRQIFFLGIFVLLFFIFGFLIVYPQFNNAPTCGDRKQNGDERGIDCGGSCKNACISEVSPVSLLWARAFQVIPGRYNAVAYLENSNPNEAIEEIRYRFRFADANNIYIGKREGSTFVPTGGRFAVFEPAIDIGNSIPVYVTFEFTEREKWIQIPPKKVEQAQILVSDITLLDAEESPKLSATVKNNTLFIIPEVAVVAILYDGSHNAISTSRTYIDVLNPEESRQVNFTWPEPLSSRVVVKEIIPMFNISEIKLK